MGEGVIACSSEEREKFGIRREMERRILRRRLKEKGGRGRGSGEEEEEEEGEGRKLEKDWLQEREGRCQKRRRDRRRKRLLRMSSPGRGWLEEAEVEAS